jgi:hypothetical protein
MSWGGGGTVGQATEYLTVPLDVMIVAWLIVIALGAIVSFYGIRVYRRTGERSMGFMASGFVLISMAAGITWFGLWLWGENLAICEMGSTAFMAGGFGTILYSLRTRMP